MTIRGSIRAEIEDHAEAVIVHTEEALGALDFVDAGGGAEMGDGSRETYQTADIALKQAVAHALLAIGLRLDILILTTELISDDEVEVG